jgi:hypothetical protein
MIKKYNYSYKKFLYFNIVGPILGLVYILINKFVLNYLYNSFISNKKTNLLILRSFIDFYYYKQSEAKKRLLDKKLFYYSPNFQKQSFLLYHSNFKNKLFEFELKNLLFFLKKFKNLKFRNICQIGASGGKNLEYFAKKINFKNKIFSDIDNISIKLAKQDFKKKFYYFKTGAQNVETILDSKLFKDKNKNNIDLFFSIGSIQYCSPVMLRDFFSQISKAKSKTLLLISEPVELDFLLRDKNFESRKTRAFNFKYDFFLKEAKIKILKKKIYKHNSLKKDKYYKNIATYFLIAQIN